MSNTWFVVLVYTNEDRNWLCLPHVFKERGKAEAHKAALDQSKVYRTTIIRAINSYAGAAHLVVPDNGSANG